MPDLQAKASRASANVTGGDPVRIPHALERVLGLTDELEKAVFALTASIASVLYTEPTEVAPDKPSWSGSSHAVDLMVLGDRILGLTEHLSFINRGVQL